MASLELRGALSVTGGCGPCGGASGDQTVRRLALKCGGFSPYETVAETPAPIRVATPGALGANFVPLDIADGFTGIEFLYAVTDSSMVLRVSDGPPEFGGIQVVQPTGFVGGETMGIGIDDLNVLVTFDVADQTLTDVVNRINAACAAAGLPTPRAVATGLNSFKLIGIRTKLEPNSTLTALVGIVSVNFAPPQITFPAPGAAVANGNDLDLNGTLLIEFPSWPNAPKQIEVSGVGAIRALVAGRTSP